MDRAILNIGRPRLLGEPYLAFGKTFRLRSFAVVLIVIT
jgi:hypothetical protein